MLDRNLRMTSGDIHTRNPEPSPEALSQIARCVDYLQKAAGCALNDIRVVRAPLRISPLGAHVDHQDGLVTGMTLDRGILLAFTPRADRQIVVHSLNFPETVRFDLDTIPPKIPRDWGNYVRGAALALQATHTLSRGMHAVVSGGMPIGGLSSSAAVGVAYLLALEHVNELAIAPQENIRLDRAIENTYLGLQNGVLDQSIILLSQRDHLTYLDCQSMQVEQIPLGKAPLGAPHADVEFLVVYSGVAQALVGTDYNLRVSQCAAAARALLAVAGEPVPAVPRLRLVPEDAYDHYRHILPEVLQKRARHFFTEIRRVRLGVEAWRAGDIASFGNLMKESGASSIYNYESGCAPLKTLYTILSDCPGVYGARFSGGGFRGSCIGLNDPVQREAIQAAIDAHYPQAHPDMAGRYSVHFCRSDGPARVLTLT